MAQPAKPPPAKLCGLHSGTATMLTISRVMGRRIGRSRDASKMKRNKLSTAVTLQAISASSFRFESFFNTEATLISVNVKKLI